MNNIKFFGKENPEVKKLLEISKAPNNIVLDIEELDAINNELQQNTFMFQDREYPIDVREMMESMLAALALQRLSKRKLESGDLRSAHICCVKSLALCDSYEDTWLLQAEIMAKHGSTVASKYMLNIAQRLHEQNRIGRKEIEFGELNEEQDWQKQKKRVLGMLS